MDGRKSSMTSLQRRFYQRTLGLVIIFGILTLLVIYYGPRAKTQKLVSVNHLVVDIQSGYFTIDRQTSAWDVSSSMVIKGELGADRWGPGMEWGWSTPWSDCEEEEQEEGRRKNRLVVKCKGRAKLTVEHEREEWKSQDEWKTKQTTDCYKVRWESLSTKFIPMDCFSVPAGHHWYGGAEVLNDRWPTDQGHMTMQHFLSNDVGLVRSGFGGVMERYWVTSSGVTVRVDDRVPLHVSVSDRQVCYKADYSDNWYQNPSRNLPVLNYTVCSSLNILQAHLHVVRSDFKPSTIPPHQSLFSSPIWSTWAKYRTDINQSSVLYYAKLIHQRGFTGCQIEIDDGYTSHYGDWVFDSAKFPHPQAMAEDLKQLGFKVTTWITPFTNTDSDHYKEGVREGYFIKSHDPDPDHHLIKWWRGIGGVVDLTNPAAVRWMKARLDSLKSQGVTAFKFDAGESNLIPDNYMTHERLTNINHYGRLYAELMYQLTDSTMVEVRVGYRSQHLPVMVRMMDKDSSWGYKRGIQTLIPTALVFGILGYPYVLPDMVGGNGYAGQVKQLPDRELYIRWLAATVLLPFIQFSIPPWDYGEGTVKMAQDLLKIREKYTEEMKEAAAHSAATAQPMIKPLWWVDPDNPQTYNIDSQFILGDRLLVAPILHQNRKDRDIYLPRGTWTDERTGKVYRGRRTIYSYQVALNELPVFRLTPSKIDHTTL